MNRSEQQFFIRHLVNQEHSSFISVYSNSEHRNFFHQLSYYKGNVPKQIEEQIDSIIKEIDRLIENLFPFWMIKIPLNIYLLSDSITKLLFKKETVKNLDILITTTSSVLSNLENTPIYFYQELFGKNINEFIDFNNFKNEYQLAFSLLEYLLKNKFKNEIKLNQEESFTIKTKDFNLNIKFSLKPIKNYINKENLNISKAYAIMMEKGGENKRPYNAFTFLETLVLPADYLNDLLNKQVTLSLYNYKIEDLEKVIEKSLIFIKNEFPEFQLNISPGPDTDYIKWKEAYLNRKNLDEILKTKDRTKINFNKI